MQSSCICNSWSSRIDTGRSEPFSPLVSCLPSSPVEGPCSPRSGCLSWFLVLEPRSAMDKEVINRKHGLVIPRRTTLNIQDTCIQLSRTGCKFVTNSALTMTRKSRLESFRPPPCGLLDARSYNLMLFIDGLDKSLTWPGLYHSVG